MLRLFGTSGIRGHAETFFTNQFCFDIGRTFAQFLTKHNQLGKVAIGMDPRESGPRIKRYFISGLKKEGWEVVDEGVAPVPSMNWLIIATDIIASTMVSGSHIKASMNGIKFFAFKEEISKEHEREIEEIYLSLKEKISFSEEQFEVTQENRAIELYKQMLIRSANVPYPRWKAVVDLGNGTQAGVIPQILEKLGLKVISLNAKLSKDFIVRDTEAEGTFQELSAKVIAEQADLGIAFDVDGDRAVFLDKDGKFIPGDYTGALIAQYHSTNIVVTPINTSQVVEHINKPVVRTKVGSPYVVAKMKEVGATFSFEANGGGFFADVMMSRDGGSTVISILNLMKKTSKSLDQLVSELPRFYLYRTKVDCPWEKDDQVLSKAKEKFKGMKIEELDGLKIWINPSSWILFRSSSNAPEFRVFAEAKTQNEATALGDEGIQLVKSVIGV